MKGFARIIELEGHDVLIKRGSNDDNKEHVSMFAVFEGVEVIQTLGFEDDSIKADEAFKNISLRQCSDFICSIQDMMRG